MRIDEITEGLMNRIETIAKEQGIEGPANDRRLAALEYLVRREESTREHLPGDLMERFMAYIDKTGELGHKVFEKFLLTQEGTFNRSKDSLKELEGMTSKEMGAYLYMHPKKGGGKVRAAQAVKEMIAANNKAKNWFDRTFISVTSLQAYIATQKDDTTAGTINAASARAVVGTPNVYGEMSEEISKHHKKHGMDSSHNASAARERRRLDLDKGRAESGG